MNSEIHLTGSPATTGTGIAFNNGDNSKTDGNPRVIGQGKAVVAELLPGQDSPVDGLTSAVNAAKDPKASQRVVAQLSDYVQSIQRNLEFRVDESTNRTVISVIDRDSQEVIRQIPSDVVLKLARQIAAMNEATGLLLEDKA